MDIPIELFLGGMGISIALAIFGFLRQPQIPAMLCFGGMFMLVFAVATDNIIMDSFLNPEVENTIVYPVDEFTGLSDISAGAAASDIRGEYVSSTSSQLFGKTIDCIELPLRKLGAPTGTATIGVYDHAQAINDPIIQAFGTIDVALLDATISNWYTFCLPQGNTYTIGNQDVIGVRYDGGDAANAVRIDITTADAFDGTITFLSSKADATNVWSSATTNDFTGVFYLRGTESVITQDPYAFTELPKTLFALMGSIFMLCGALMVLRNN